MRVIFLDFDGVINSAEYHIRKELERQDDDRSVDWWTSLALDPVAVALLGEIVAKTGAKVVVSSTWRRMCCVAELRRVLRDAGFKGEVIGDTPHYLGIGKRRGDEIHDWLSEHDGVEGYVILDDDDDMGIVRKHLVQTTHEKGLTRAHVGMAIAMLREPNDVQPRRRSGDCSRGCEES